MRGRGGVPQAFEGGPPGGGRRLVPVLCLVLLFLSLGHGDPAAAATLPVEVGQPAPDFTLPGLDGKPVSYGKDIRGKAPLTLLFFMTTACSACYEELKEIDAFLRKNPGRADAWCVAVDLRGERTVAPFAKANGFRVNYLVDPKFSLPRAFGFNYTPSLAILDGKGVVLHKKGGYSPNGNLSDLIRTFLK